MPAKIAVVIPARWGSTRFPGKPLHPICGKPLLQHVWERATRAKRIERVIVATDDTRIAKAAKAFGAEVAMTSKRHRSGTDRIAEVAAKMRGFSHLINLQGDEPLIDPKLITRLADTLAGDPALEMITAADPIDTEAEMQNPHAVKVVLDRAGHGLYFSRSPIPFVRERGLVQCYRHQGIYGYTVDFLRRFVKWRPGLLEQTEQLEQLRALEHGTRIRVLVTNHRAVGVDVPEDAAAVERLIQSAAIPTRRTVRKASS